MAELPSLTTQRIAIIRQYRAEMLAALREAERQTAIARELAEKIEELQRMEG